MPRAGPPLLLSLSFFLPTGDWRLLAGLPAPPVSLLRRSNEVLGEHFLLGTGDGDRDGVEDLSLVTEPRPLFFPLSLDLDDLLLLGDFEGVFRPLDLDLDDLLLLGDLEGVFRPLSLELDDLLLLGDLERVFFPLDLDLDLRLREEDLCL